jgi:genome maintenance exonuclease 1
MMFTVKRTNKFVHNFIHVEQSPRVEINGIRHYQTPAGTFKSVTTILGEKLDKSGLLAWKERVGEEEAAKVSTQASRRGTAIHNLAEAYLMNNENWKKGAMPVNLDTFSRIRPVLDLNVGSIYGIEIPLYSARLKAAGTCDLLAGFRGINSVIDFKTSKRVKKEEDIEGYFLQAACYSLMAEELTDLKFPQIVIIMSVDNEESLVFIKRRDDYVDRVLEVFA